MKDNSKNEIEVYYAPINSDKHSSQNVKPNYKVTLTVDPNTAVYISNKSNDTATVNYKVTGDLALSMSFKN